MKFLCVGQDVLLVDPCESRCRHGHSNSQSGSQSACGEGQPQAGAEGGSGGAEQRGHFKGLSPVSNSSQRDYAMLSSLFNLRLKRGLFVSLVFHCFSLCHSITSGLQGKCGSRFR